MRCGIFGLLAAVMGVFLAADPVLGHHAISAKFDPEQVVTLEGLVTKVDWLNPHAHVFMDVTGADGAVTSWAIELESPIDLRKGGWSPDTVRLGDSITVESFIARDGSGQAWGNSVVLSGNGRRVFDVPDPSPSGSSAPARPTPRWPDRRPRLGPPPGETGYWGNPSATTLVQAGASVDWALALYEYRQRNFLRDDPTFLYCIPPAGPRQFQVPYGVQLVENRARQRIFLLQGGGNRNFRIIYLDGRDQVGELRGDSDNPLYLGRSVGEWDGDTLVIDTIGFNERFWITNGGLPHTDQLHMIERLSRPDFDTLNYQVTIDDPGAYTRTWTSSWTLEWIPGEEMPVYLCQSNRP